MKIPQTAAERASVAKRRVLMADPSIDKSRFDKLFWDIELVGSTDGYGINYDAVFADLNRRYNGADKAEDKKLILNVAAAYQLRELLYLGKDKTDDYLIPSLDNLIKIVQKRVVVAEQKQKEANEAAADSKLPDLMLAIKQVTKEENETQKDAQNIYQRICLFLEKRDLMEAPLEEQVYAVENAKESEWKGIWPEGEDIIKILGRSDAISQQRAPAASANVTNSPKKEETPAPKKVTAKKVAPKAKTGESGIIYAQAKEDGNLEAGGVLKRGAREEEDGAVHELQRGLTYVYGELKFGDDGVYGGNTKAKVEQLQAEYGLNTDGVVGDMTKLALNIAMLKKVTEAGDKDGIAAELADVQALQDKGVALSDKGREELTAVIAKLDGQIKQTDGLAFTALTTVKKTNQIG